MNDCTILIPTYNRPRLLNRLLQYLDAHDIPLQVIIGDSSEPAIQKINAQACGFCRHLDIQVIHYPTDMNPFLKCADLARYSMTEFTVFCADDDFLNPGMIPPAVTALRQNPTYISWHGDYYGFKNSRRMFYWKPIYDPCIIDADKKEYRLRLLLQHYRPSFYDIHRTLPLKKMFNEIVRNNVDPVAYGELALAILTVLNGKIGYTPGFHMARAVDSKVTFQPSLYHNLDMKSYMTFCDLIGPRLSEFFQPLMDDYITSTKHQDAYRRHVNLVHQLHIPIAIDERLRSLQPSYRKFTTTPAPWGHDYPLITDLVMRRTP